MMFNQAEGGMAFHRLQHSAWLYYRSDITLKRLECQVLSNLYKDDHPRWSNESIPYLTRVTRGLESQLDAW